MPTYKIAGKTIQTDVDLTDAQIEEIANNISGTSGTTPISQAAKSGVDPDVPTPENIAQAMKDRPTQQKPSLTERIVETAKSTLPEFGATGGGIAGFALGGPVGGVIGAGLGGMFGTVSEDLVRQEASEFKDILQEGATQAAFEASGGLVARIGGRLVEYTPDVLRSFGIQFGGDPAEALRVLTTNNAPSVSRAGTPESIQSTQQLLSERGGTLSKVQTGLAGVGSRFMENIGRIGLTGSGRFDAIQKNNEQIISDSLTEVVEGVSGRLRDPSEIGELFVDTVNAGKRQLSAQYRDGLNSVQNAFGNNVVDTRAIKAKTNKVLEENRQIFEEGRGSLLEPETITQLERIVQLSDKVPAKDLIEFLKTVNQRSSALLDPAGQGYNSVASAQVEDFLTNNFRPFVDSQLEKIDADAFARYQNINKSYSASKNALSPELLKAVARKGKREDFVGVGQALFGTTNPESVKKAFKALEEAKKVNPDLNTFEAMDALRQGYLSRLIGGADREFSNIVKVERQLNNNVTMNSMFETVLGTSAPSVRRLVNAAADVSDVPSEGFLGLLLRGKEAQSLTALGTLYAGESVAGLAGVGGALALLSSPAIFARISTNPKAVNKLINLNKASRKMAPQVLSANLIRFGNEFGVDIEGEAQKLLEEAGLTQNEE